MRSLTAAALLLLLPACPSPIAGSNDGGADAGLMDAGRTGSPFGMHPATIVAPAGGLSYDAALEMGVRWHRPTLYVFWSEVQTSLASAALDFSKYDVQFNAVPAAIHVLANLSVAPPPKAAYLVNAYLPVNEPQYRAFVRATVERYDGDGVDDAPGLANPVRHWQVGNEPSAVPGNGSFATLQRMTYEEVKAACAECVVVAGGVPQPSTADAGFTVGAAEYGAFFEQDYNPILVKLAGTGFDVFDLHWYGTADGDYRKLGPVLSSVRQKLAASGFGAAPIWMTEMGAYSGAPAAVRTMAAQPLQSEAQQAADYLKRFIYPLSLGVEKVFPAFGLMEGFKNDNSYFDHTGFIFNGDTAVDPQDLGRGVKKLSFFTYRKMTELLEGSDWASMSVVSEAGSSYLVRVLRAGQPVYVGWSDAAPTQVALTGLSSSGVRITSMVPHFTTGQQVADYATAFDVADQAVADGAVQLSLGQNPVVIEPR